MPTAVLAKVAAISLNTNSFGLRQAVLITRDGQGLEGCFSPYSGGPKIRIGQVISVVVEGEGWHEVIPSRADQVEHKANHSLATWELPRIRPKPPESVLKLLWGNSSAPT